MFEIGDYVVYPGHGVGQIINLQTKCINEQTFETASVKIISNGMKMIVPLNKNELRPLVTEREIEGVFELLKDRDFNPNKETWNRRHRTFMQQVNSGSLLEIADVLRNILILKAAKKLSFGEKKMVNLCKDLIVQEIALISGSRQNEVVHQIDSLFVSSVQ